MAEQLKMMPRNDLGRLQTIYQRERRIQIHDFLNKKSAKRIYQSLDSQAQWNLAWNLNGQHHDMDYNGVEEWSPEQKQKLDEMIHEQAAHDFQYRFAAIPIHDIYKNQLLPGHFFNTIYEFMNSEAVLSFVRKITGHSNISFADMQATRYSKGHFLTEHDDDVEGKNRLAAYVINLTPEWRPDWGGALIFPQDNKPAEAWFPEFNVLNIFKVPQKHAVTIISPFAPANRYSITGWFRAE